MSKHRKYDDREIDLLQQRIYLHRLSLRLRVDDLKEAMRERIRKPSTLIGAAGAGFLLGRLTRGSRHKATGESKPGRSLLSVFSEAMHTVLKFVGSGPGLWLASRVVARATEPDTELRAEVPASIPPQPL